MKASALKHSLRRLVTPLFSLLLHTLLFLLLFHCYKGKQEGKKKESPAWEGIEVATELFTEQPEITQEKETEADIAPENETPTPSPTPEEALDTEENAEQTESADTETTMPAAEKMPTEIADGEKTAPAQETSGGDDKTPFATDKKEIFRNRKNARARARAIRRAGGPPEVEKSVLAALRWFKEHQNANGSWSSAEQSAMTGLALLAFLAHGETPSSPEFGETVQKAMAYLTRRIQQAEKPEPDYRNGIVAYALAEAYGFTRQKDLLPAAEKALRWIVEGQQKNGGYDYHYKKESRWDLSVSCWQYQAMHAGIVADIHVPGLKKAFAKGEQFIRQTTYSKEKRRFGYSSPGKGTDGLQGAALYCLQLMGANKCEEARQTARFIAKECPVRWEETTKTNKNKQGAPGKRKGGADNPLYAWYYQTQAMFRAGGEQWRTWNPRFARELIRHQKKDGHWECPNASPRPVRYEQYYTTAMAALTLQVYYRYLPSHK